MSLVDYGSSDDDGSEADENAKASPSATAAGRDDHVEARPSTSSSELRSGREIDRRQSEGPPLSGTARVILPDVSELFGPGVSNASQPSGTQRKRPLMNGTGHPIPRPKLPRGTSLQPARVAPDTAGGLLTPPQLRGRSNVATEDLERIFSRRQTR